MRPGCDTLNSLMYILVRQGLVWLFIASVSEVIPVVRLFFWPFLLAHRHFTSQVFMALNLNGTYLFPLINQNRALIKHYSN